MLDDDRERVLEDLGVDVVGAHQQERARPVDRLGDRRRLLEVQFAHHVDDLDQPGGQLLVDVGGMQPDDLDLALGRRVVEPEVEAAALEGLGEFPRVVGGEQHDRVGGRLDAAHLRDRDLEVGEQLEKHRLELLVGLVDLVDQQDHRLGVGDRAHQGALEQELRSEDLTHRRGAGITLGGRGSGLDLEELLAIVPLVQCLGLVQSFVALEPDQLAAGGTGEGLGQLGLADAGRPFDEDRLAQPLGEEGDQCGRVIGEVGRLAEAGLYFGRSFRGCADRRHGFKNREPRAAGEFSRW